eukprot:g4926.t1
MDSRIPKGANEGCPGTDSVDAGKRESCAGCPNQSICASGATQSIDPDLNEISNRLETVQHKILVLSGKGGVGKSTIASQLAFTLATSPDRDVGLLDIDICGPSIPKMLGLEGQEVHQSGAGWSPVYLEDNLGVMSIGFMLPNPNDAVIWRGPRKNALIKQFLKDVDWGDLDYLVIDAPPGTSDEHISIAQYLKTTSVDGAIIVTTPQTVAIADVRKEINFCRKVGLPIIGIVENMRDLIQPIEKLKFFIGEQEMTTRVVEILKEEWSGQELLASVEVLDASKGGGEALARESGVPFLGSIPLDPVLSRSSETGTAVSKDSISGKALNAITQEIIKSIKNNELSDL